MSKTFAVICLVFGVLLMIECAGDDVTNPVTPTDASADATTDQRASEASSGGPDSSGPDSDGSPADATGN